MAKGIDPFEKFRTATLSSSTLGDAVKSAPVTPAPSPAPEVPQPQPAVAATPLRTVPGKEEILTPVTQKVSKVSNKDQIGFYLDRELKRKLGMLKFELGVQYNDLYEEAISDLLRKYNKL